MSKIRDRQKRGVQGRCSAPASARGAEPERTPREGTIAARRQDRGTDASRRRSTRLSTSWRDLEGTGVAVICASALVVVAVIVVSCAHFIANIQLIQADYDYRIGQGYEQDAGNLAGQQGQIATAEATYQAAISDYQNALNTLPSWNGTPDVRRLQPVPRQSVSRIRQCALHRPAEQGYRHGDLAQVEEAFQNAANVFVAAAKANPLNPDHPRNLGKLYLEWSGVNSSQARSAEA